MNDVLLIFDIDGTILRNGTVTRDLFYKVFTEVTGEQPRTDGVTFAGQTDKGIFRSLLENSSKSDSFEILFAEFKELFIAEVSLVYDEVDGPFLLPGVPELLNHLDDLSRAYLALGTGNIRETAFVKLKRFGLDELFELGGFGGDFEDRATVLKNAAIAAERGFGCEFAIQNIWVIGDTENDIIAAQKNNFRTIGVATGIGGRAGLKKANPDFLLDDLSDLQLFLEHTSLHDKSLPVAGK